MLLPCLQSQLLALYCLSEIGWLKDILSAHPAALTSIVGLFSNPSEDIKMAAAFALGGLCVGNPTNGLRVLLGSLDHSGNTYLLLTALKVGRGAGSGIPAHSLARSSDSPIPGRVCVCARGRELKCLCACACVCRRRC